ncbi:MAG: ACT domain-containing protein [Anaerolineae bacterium]|nr:MAG: ACT domain-containing protein [Anaerolineae bacterium]
MTSNLTLTLLPGEYTVHRLPPEAPIPFQALRGAFYALTRTAEELSLVCPSEVAVPGNRHEAGWALLKVEGPLDFGMIGVLADLSGALATAGVSLFAISTFDTDYLLVKAEDLSRALAALRAAGHRVDGAPEPPEDESPPPWARPRRRDRAIQDEAWIISFLERADYGVLATCVGGRPFTVARNFVYVPERRCIYLHGARAGRTYETVLHGARANFNVSEMGRLLPADTAMEMGVEYAGVVVFGRVSLVEDPDEAKDALRRLVEKYFPHLRAGRDYTPVQDVDLKVTAVLRLDVEAWSGKQKQAPPDFPGAFWWGEKNTPKTV